MNILFLVSRSYYEQKMSRCRFHQLDAVGRHPGVSVQMWGNGFVNYDSDAPLSANIRRMFGITAFDLVHVYKPGEHKDVARCPLPKSIDYNEAWDQKAVLKEVLQNDLRLLIFHHENDWQNWSGEPRLATGRTLLHIPHAAERSIFAPAALPWAERTVPIVLTGRLNPHFYPLRSRCAALIQAGRLPGEVRSHPGYHATNAVGTAQQFVDYAKHLGRSRLALTLGITYRYALAKYPEAAMAGCLLIGDVPEELTPTLGRYMVRLEPDMSDDQIVDTVAWWLQNDSAAQERAAESYKLSLKAFTMEHYAERFVQVARDFLHQQTHSKHSSSSPGVSRMIQKVKGWLPLGTR